jgi:hypothetical protein
MSLQHTVIESMRTHMHVKYHLLFRVLVRVLMYLFVSVSVCVCDKFARGTKRPVRTRQPRRESLIIG